MLSKHDIIAGGFRAIAASGADRWLAPVSRGRGLILTFHHVRPARNDLFRPNALLEITPDFLSCVIQVVRRAGFEIVPLDEVPDRLARPSSTPFVALTFDDGYRDNVEHALPVLEAKGCPWTCFVTVDYASGSGRLWWVELEEAVRRLGRVPFGAGERRRDLPATTLDEKAVAFATIYRELRAGPEDVLRGAIGALCVEAGIETDALVRSLCLSWDEVVDLSRRPGVTIGAHTLSHPMLAKHEDAVARREIARSGALIAERIGRPVRHLAYPVGDPGSAGPREFALAGAAGYATAVTTRPGHLFAAHAVHLTALPRVSVNGLFQSEAALRALLSGVPFLAWNRGRRVNVS